MSKELATLKDLLVEFDEMGYEPSITLCPDRIEEINSFGRRLKNVLLTFQEQEKVIEILAKKQIYLDFIHWYNTCEEYNNNRAYCGVTCDWLTEEEFDLLKKWLR